MVATNQYVKYILLEMWLSGRKRLRAKELGVYAPQRFESSHLRYYKKFRLFGGVFC